MRFLKFSLLTLTCVLASVSFVSCGNDDEPESEKGLTGTWFGTSTRYDEEKLEIIFRSDNTYQYTWYEDYYNDPTDVEVSKGTYERLSGSVIKLHVTELDGVEEDEEDTLHYTLDSDGKTLTIGEIASETFVCTRK